MTKDSISECMENDAELCQNDDSLMSCEDEEEMTALDNYLMDATFDTLPSQRFIDYILNDEVMFNSVSIGKRDRCDVGLLQFIV